MKKRNEEGINAESGRRSAISSPSTFFILPSTSDRMRP
jgi:hypothetical protein